MCLLLNEDATKDFKDRYPNNTALIGYKVFRLRYKEDDLPIPTRLESPFMYTEYKAGLKVSNRIDGELTYRERNNGIDEGIHLYLDQYSAQKAIEWLHKTESYRPVDEQIYKHLVIVPVTYMTADVLAIGQWSDTASIRGDNDCMVVTAITLLEKDYDAAVSIKEESFQCVS